MFIPTIMVHFPRYCSIASILFTCIATISSQPVWSSDAISEGHRLIQQVYDRPDGVDVSSRGYMILTEQGYEPRVRRMFSYTFRKDSGETLSLLRFTAPKDIADVGLLTKDYPEKNSDQWLYLPALGRARRISASRKGGRLVGSDYYYEDLEVREVELDTHRYLGEQKLGGALCKLVESIPVDTENSVYNKRISWIHPATMIPLQIDYYQEGSESPVKRLKVYRIARVQGYWTVMDTGMTDLETGHQTRMKTEKIIYDRGLNESLFSQQILIDPTKESHYRP